MSTGAYALDLGIYVHSFGDVHRNMFNVCSVNHINIYLSVSVGSGVSVFMFPYFGLASIAVPEGGAGR